MLANRPGQFQLSLAVSELVWYSSCCLHVTIRHNQGRAIQLAQVHRDATGGSWVICWIAVNVENFQNDDC